MRSSLILQLFVLRKALNVYGSEEVLRRKLSVSAQELRTWLDGKETLPLVTFNRAMQLVNCAYREEKAKHHSKAL